MAHIADIQFVLKVIKGFNNLQMLCSMIYYTFYIIQN